MVQHLLHIQNLVTPEIWYNIRRFRRLVSPLGASGSGFGIFLPPPVQDAEREKSASPFSRLSHKRIIFKGVFFLNLPSCASAGRRGIMSAGNSKGPFGQPGGLWKPRKKRNLSEALAAGPA